MRMARDHAEAAGLFNGPGSWILAVWLAIFVTGAVWCLRRDTARV